MNTMTIGQIARNSGTSIETIRFYEREGLIEKPPRTESGYRNYQPDVISRLSFIRQAKSLGFSLMEIKELLALKFSPETNCGDVRNRAEIKILDIEHKIDSLQGMKRALVKLVTACPGNGPASECPILEAMETKKLG
ncbi:MAG: heavy metal-responsive transcriptional regulator [Methylobacter sp.]|nr:heavy metal-responsive transcriptional regulator [Methylobacter sp.]